MSIGYFCRDLYYTVTLYKTPRPKVMHTTQKTIYTLLKRQYIHCMVVWMLCNLLTRLHAIYSQSCEGYMYNFVRDSILYSLYNIAATLTSMLQLYCFCIGVIIECDGCSQYCTNTEGSFECACIDGYILDSDGKNCSGTTVMYTSHWTPYKEDCHG